MTIGEILKHKDIYQYNRLKNMFKTGRPERPESKKEIKLGCSVEELMKHDSYCREGRRIKQKSWG